MALSTAIHRNQARYFSTFSLGTFGCVRLRSCWVGVGLPPATAPSIISRVFSQRIRVFVAHIHPSSFVDAKLDAIADVQHRAQGRFHG